MAVKCGHCSTRQRAVYHKDVKEVRFCGFTAARQTLAANTRTDPSWGVPGAKPAWSFQTPQVMVENMRDGRYAVAPGTAGAEKDQHVFIRVSRPKTGKKKGALVIQTQHSDDYRPFITFWPSGQIYVAKQNDRLDQALLMVAADPFTSAMKYAELWNVCSRCGKQLTDAKSRWYGIGPECEKHWPEIINYVNETRGAFSG
jgi:hypothetical protein